MCVLCVCVHVCVMCTPGALGRQKKEMGFPGTGVMDDLGDWELNPVLYWSNKCP